MKKLKLVGRSGVWLRAALMASSALLLGQPAAAQNVAQPRESAPPVVGPPQLRDFQLTPRERIVTQPQPTPGRTETRPEPSRPAASQPAERDSTQSRPEPARSLPPAPRAPVRTAPAVPSQPVADTPAPDTPVADQLLPVPSQTSTSPEPAPVSAPEAGPGSADVSPQPGSPPSDGLPLWLVLLGGLALVFGGYTIFTRRRAATRRALALPDEVPAAAVQPAAPRAPRPDPVPRAWIEIELTPERTTADPDNSVVEFEMALRNVGGSPARNIKLQAKLICSTPDQDKEIAAFHRKKPGEHRTLPVPDLQPGQELRLKGQVDAKREDLKALRVDQKLLFVPLVAVNAFYDWGTVRTGQTSKSFLIGREKPDRGDRMAPFRLDLGPRVYRTVGQRPYRVERRV